MIEDTKILNELNSIISKYDLEIFANDIRRIALPSVHMKLSDISQLDLGESHFWGTPDVPKDFEYPLDNKGNQLNFLCQINLYEIPDFKGKELPGFGMLYFFFADCDFDSENQPHKVIYTDTKDLTSYSQKIVQNPQKVEFILKPWFQDVGLGSLLYDKYNEIDNNFSPDEDFEIEEKSFYEDLGFHNGKILHLLGDYTTNQCNPAESAASFYDKLLEKIEHGKTSKNWIPLLVFSGFEWFNMEDNFIVSVSIEKNCLNNVDFSRTFCYVSG
jgi:uncharacterized protein YwqG